MPGNQLRTKTVIRFGSFEADLHTQELRKHGILLRLRGQSFQVLQMLLERQGELVTRDELPRFGRTTHSWILTTACMPQSAA